MAHTLSAGVTAGIDLCLSLVAEDWGQEVAVKVAKRLVVYVHYVPLDTAEERDEPVFVEEAMHGRPSARPAPPLTQ